MLEEVFEGAKYRNIKTRDIYTVEVTALAEWDHEQLIVIYRNAHKPFVCWARSMNDFKDKFENIDEYSM